MKLFELKQQHKHAVAKADSIITAAETAGRPMTATEEADVTMALNAAKTLAIQIGVSEKKTP
jgi:hypothetical protein